MMMDETVILGDDDDGDYINIIALIYSGDNNDGDGGASGYDGVMILMPIMSTNTYSTPK